MIMKNIDQGVTWRPYRRLPDPSVTLNLADLMETVSAASQVLTSLLFGQRSFP